MATMDYWRGYMRGVMNTYLTVELMLQTTRNTIANGPDEYISRIELGILDRLIKQLKETEPKNNEHSS